MEKPDCDKFEFDYWKHIVIKNIISTEYRWYSQDKDIFQAHSLDLCDKCMIQGILSSSTPFNFSDIPTDELGCTLYRMGLKKINSTDLHFMPLLKELEGDIYCPHCYEIVEDKLIDDMLSED